MCAASKRKNCQPPEHKCFKNWCGSSSAMEADIIVDGFLQSMPEHNVKYFRMIGDGDSNVYKKILDARPYGNTIVEKIECKNHLLRNFCNKLKGIALNTKLGPIKLRKIVGNNVLRLRNAIVKAAEYRKDEGALKLRSDIMNSPMHVFGDHQNCDKYFCVGRTDQNYIPELKDSGILYKIMEVINNMAFHAQSLLYNANNNAVEELNSIIAKHVGGKRINFSLKGSYQTRCNMSVVSHNTKQKYRKIYKVLCDNSPGRFCKKRESKQAKRKTKSKKKQKEIKRRALFQDEAYGSFAQKPDMPEQEYNEKRKLFLDDLCKMSSKRAEIERKTVLQADCAIWREERRKLLTASNFGIICNKLPTTSCRNIVKKILYSSIDTPGMKYGRMHESDAIKDLEEFANVKVKKCGLYIDEEFNFLGASPDGIVEEDNDCIVEVKCPSSCAELFPNEAIMQRKFKFWKTDKMKSTITEVNKKHAYYYQVQGQLHISKKKYCLFALWTPKGIKVEKIERDFDFWNKEMVLKLKNFYLDCLLPEILDPRHTRSMIIRDPQDISEAIKKKETEQQLLTNNEESK